MPGKLKWLERTPEKGEVGSGFESPSEHISLDKSKDLICGLYPSR